jgi:hypothetical protein
MCHSLTTVSFELGSNLAQIEDYAFNDCRFLSCVEIPSQVDTLTSDAFCCCWSLSRLTFEMPSRLRQFELPQHRNRILCIPDSVQTVTGLIPCKHRSLRLIQFGQESRLTEIALERPDLNYISGLDPEARCRLFGSLSEPIVRRFRLRLAGL